MNWYITWLTRRPRSVLAIVLAVTAIMAVGIARVESRNSQESGLPLSDPMVATRLRFEQVFKNRAVVMIGIQAEDVYAPSTLEKVVRVTEGLRGVRGVLPDRIVSLSTVQDVTTRGDSLEIHPLMREVPRTPAEVAALRAAVEANDLVAGRLVSRDGKLVATLAFLQDDYDREKVYHDVSALIAPLQGPEEVFAAGDAIFTTQIEEGTQRDSRRLVPLAFLAVGLGLYLCFRRVLGVLLPFAAVAVSIAWTMGTMGLLGLPQTVISAALPVLMMVVAGSYGIHLMLHYYDAPADLSPAGATAYALRRSMRGIIMAGTTAAMAAATLLAFRVRSIREFAIALTAGLVLAVIVAFTVTPALLCLVRRPRKRAAGGGALASWLRRATLAAVDHRRVVLLACGAAALAALFGVTRIRTGNDFQEIFPSDHLGRRTFEAFNTHLGGVRTLNVMIDGGRPNAIKSPEYLRSISEFQRAFASERGVGSTFSVADVVRQVHRTFALPGDLPSSQAEVAQELLMFEMGSDASEVADLVDTTYQRTNVTMTIATSDPDVHKQLYRTLQAYLATHLPAGAHAEMGGEVLFWLAQVDYVILGKILNVAATIVIVFLYIALVYRSWTAGVLCMASVVFGTLLTFGLMGAWGIRLDFATAIITSIAVGIGVDFSIQYLNDLTENAGTASTLQEALLRTASSSGRQVLFTAGANMLGFLVIVMSDFLPVRHFGLLVSVAMFSMGAGSLFLLPVLAATIRPRFLPANARFWQEKPRPTAATVAAPV